MLCTVLLVFFSKKELKNRSEQYDSFYRAIIKKTYNAPTVTIDREDDLMVLEITPYGNFQENHTIHLQIPVTRWQDFLISCIEQDRSSIKFYQNILGYFSMNRKPISNASWQNAC